MSSLHLVQRGYQACIAYHQNRCDVPFVTYICYLSQRCAMPYLQLVTDMCYMSSVGDAPYMQHGGLLCSI